MNIVNGKTWTTEKILRTLEEESKNLQKMGVRKIGLFGSYRHDKPHPDSDMDFVVVLEHQTFDGYMNVKIFLEDLFNCQVDLVLAEGIKPRLRPYILGEVIYASGL